MHVLVINTSESTGGAAIAASRLVDALNHHGVKARMLVRDKQTERVTTIAIPARLRLRAAFLWERLCIWTANRFRRKGLWAVDIANAGVDVTTLPEFREADVIHLNWVNQGLLSMSQIERILRSGKPVVWTLHDFWPVTSICHHPADCTSDAEHCHTCPQLVAPHSRDLSWRVFERKLKAYDGAPLTFVAVSQWVRQRALRSALVGKHAVEVIPNIIPTALFHPEDKQQARAQLGVPAHDRVVVFGAARIDQPLKGLNLLIQALRLLVDDSQAATADGKSASGLTLLLFGGCKDHSVLSDIPCHYVYTGPVSDGSALSRLYAAADVVVSASAFETFGLTLAEAMACGCTPVSFDRGGQTDIISHRENGYLAHYPDTDDLAAGLKWAFEADLSSDALHHSVASRFGEDAIARRHLDLYERLLQRR